MTQEEAIKLFQDWLEKARPQAQRQDFFHTQSPPVTTKPDLSSRLETRVRRLETGEIRLRRGTVQPSNGSFARPSLDNLEFGDVRGRIDLRNTDVRKLGSLPPTVVDGFAISYTDTQATVYWDGTNGSSQPQIRRADGTYLVIPPSNMSITGLTASTLYYMLPFWSTDAEGDSCGTVGWVAGDTGSPMFCMTQVTTDQLHQQILQGREALAHPTISFTTGAPAAGTAQTTSGGGSVTAGTSAVDSSGRVRFPTI